MALHTIVSARAPWLNLLRRNKTYKRAEVPHFIIGSVRAADISNRARVEAADEQGAAAAPAGPRDRPLMNSLFSRMGTSWSRPTDAPPPPGDGPRAPPPPPLGAPQPPGKDDDVYRPRDRSPDSVLEDVGAWARDDGSAPASWCSTSRCHCRRSARGRSGARCTLLPPSLALESEHGIPEVPARVPRHSRNGYSYRCWCH